MPIYYTDGQRISSTLRVMSYKKYSKKKCKKIKKRIIDESGYEIIGKISFPEFVRATLPIGESLGHAVMVTLKGEYPKFNSKAKTPRERFTFKLAGVDFYIADVYRESETGKCLKTTKE